MNTAAHHTDEDNQRYPYWRRNRYVIAFANFVCGMGFNLVWPFVPLMVRGLGVRENLETWVGYMLLVFYLVSFAVSPVWGGIADHYGRKLMVLRAMIGIGVAMLLMPLAETPLAFAALLMLIAVFNGFTPAGVSLLVANTPPQRIGSAVALAQTGGLVGQALGPVLGAMLIALFEVIYPSIPTLLPGVDASAPAVAAAFSQTTATIILYAVVLLILVFRPQGIFGEKVQRRA
jgi:MFS family permease